jgi:hypothetical protein
MRHFL